MYCKTCGTCFIINKKAQNNTVVMCVQNSRCDWRSGNAFDSINEVTLRRAGLVLRWVTACGQVNYLGMQPAA